LGGVDGARGLHVLDYLFHCDLCTVLILIDGEDQHLGKYMVQVLDKLLIHKAGCIVYLGNHKELVEADKECFDGFTLFWYCLEDCLASRFLKVWVTEVLVCSGKELCHCVGAIEDVCLMDGEIVATP